jgi:hypothetical protein
MAGSGEDLRTQEIAGYDFFTIEDSKPCDYA